MEEHQVDADAAKKLLTEERNRLQQLREGLAEERQQGGAGGEDISELSSVDQHPADIGSEEFEREKDLSILESLESELVAIKQAFDRLEAGNYGKCEVCGKDIGDERLEARPAATLCIEHQQQAERALQ
jgi:RNA polymerase-binding protein DksA